MSPECAHVLAELHQKALGSTVEGWDEESLLVLLGTKAAVVTTIDRDGNLNRNEGSVPLVGFALSLKAEPEADLLTIAISPQYQGRGLGKILMNAHSQTLRDQGIRTWYLEVHEHNEPAIAFYKKMGFRVSTQRPNYYPAWEGGTLPRASALVMCRNLD